MQIRVLGDDDVRRLLDLDELLEALARGFSALSGGQVSAPPRNGVDVAGHLDERSDGGNWSNNDKR